MMKLKLLMLSALSGLLMFSANATVHTVTASGTSFTPSTLSITAGDTVVWNNTSGTHNVNGTIATFSSNPVSFGNGSPAVSPWTYSFQFLVPGTYSYQCDLHAPGMSGTITVTAAPSTLAAGDIMFTAFNADGSDGFAFTTFVDIPANTNIWFTDEEWNGTAFASGKGSGEGDIMWTNSSLTPAGTVIFVDSLSSGTLTASTGTATLGSNNGPNLGASNEGLYAFLGTERSPVMFLAATANNTWTSTGSSPGAISGTGLVLGTSAQEFADVNNSDDDVVDYTGARSGMTIAQYKTLLFNYSNFAHQGGSGDQSNDGTAPDVPFNTTPFTFGAAGVPGYPYYTIAQLTTNDALGAADSLNVAAQIRGTVFSIDFDGNSGYSFFIYDATGGINVYRSSDKANYTSPQVGDSIMILGSIDQYNGLTEMVVDSVQLISGSHALKAPTVVTALGENTESEYIRMNGYHVATPSQWPASGSSANVDITNGVDTVVMRIDSDTDIDGSPVPSGNFDVIGAGGQFDFSSPYDEGYQIQPSSLADIMVTSSIPGYPYYTIDQLTTNDASGVADSLNVAAQIRGTVFSIDFDGNSGYSFFMYDATGGINVYRSSDKANYTNPQVGDSIMILGSIDQYNGLTEMVVDSIQLISANHSLKTPAGAIALGENTESEYIRMNGYHVATPSQWPASGSSANVDITNGVDTVVMRIDSDTDIDGSPVPTGSFDVIGAGGQFDNSSPYDEGYQIQPSSLADILMNASVPGYPAYTISQVTTNDVNGVADSIAVSVQLNGTIFSIDFDGNSGYSFFMYDATGGINVFSSSDKYGYTNPQVGDAIEVYGDIDQYNGLTEIVVDSIYLKSTGNPLISPAVTTTLGENTESEYIRMNGMQLVTPSQWPASGSSANVDITDGTNTFVMRIDNDTDIDGSPVPTGTIDVIGAGGQFDSSNPYTSGYQIQPSSLADIIPSVPTVPTVNFARGAQTEPESVGSITVNLLVNPTSATNDTIDLQVTPGVGVTVPGDGSISPLPSLTGLLRLYVPANEDTASFQISVIDDAVMEANETLFVNIVSATAGITVGSLDSYYLVIEDNDTPIPTYNIADVTTSDANGVADSLGKDVRVYGVVYTDDFDDNAGYSFYIYDHTGGVNIFNFNDVGTFAVNRGDSIKVVGSVDQYNGLTEIFADSLEVISSGNTLKQPAVVSTLNESTESEYIRMNDMRFADPTQWTTGSGTGGFNVDIYNATDTFVMRIDNAIDLYNLPLPATGKFDVIGAGSQFDGSNPYTGGYQIFPRDMNDIIAEAPPKLAVTEVMASSNQPAGIDGDWFEVTNYGTDSIDMNGYSWDDDSRMAGTHTITSSFGIAPGESVIFLDAIHPNDSTWLYFWKQAANGLRVITKDDFGPIGFSSLSSAGDEVNLYDNNGALLSQVIFAGTDVTAGFSLQFDTTGTLLGNSVDGVDGAYTSGATTPDVGNPGNMKPISLREFTEVEVSMYPNPATDRVFVESATTTNKVITVTSITGKVMTSISSEDRMIEINTSHFSRGVYLITIEIDGQKATRKVIVQ